MNAPTAAPVLELTDLRRSFGSLVVVDTVSLRVRTGARHAVIGPNGAGKSTLFNLIAGALRPDSGRIAFRGQQITRLPEYRRSRLGIARTFQHGSVFPGCTAVENVLLALQRAAGQGWSMTRPVLRRRRLVDRALASLDQVGLAPAARRQAGELSHGERRQLELALTLATDPAVILLDEPAAGISAADTQTLTTILAGLPRDMTVLMIEHDLDLVFDIADTVTVLHLGKELRTGPPAEIRADDEVQLAYLGESTDDLFAPAGHEDRDESGGRR